MAVVREIDEVVTESKVLNDLGLTLRAAGDLDGAAELHTAALREASRIQGRYQVARAHDGLGHALRGSQPATAREHWARALALFTAMEVPERFHVERSLAEFDAP
jgi:hypothetical protein